MKLEKLTQEQEDLIISTRNQWIDRFNNTRRINKKQFEAGIKWLYEDLLKKKNPKVLYCESWLEALLTIDVLQNNVEANVRDNVWANVRDNVEANVRDNVWANVRDNVGANVRDNVWANVEANVWDNVRANVWTNVGANVWANVRDNVRANVEANVWDNVRDNVWANVEANVWDNVRANVWDNVMANVEANVRANVRDNVRDNVWDNVEANVWDNVWANVRDNVRANVGADLQKIFLNYSNYLGSGSNFGWASFYDYFEKIGVLKNEKFKKYKNLIQAGAFQVYEYENYVFAIQPPNTMLRNEQNQLNSISEMAFKWNDDYGFYYVNGLNLSEELFIKLRENKYTILDFSQEKNEEVKSAVISFIQQRDGEEGVYRFFKENLTEVDTFIDKKESKYLEGTTNGMNIGVYTLFKGQINSTKVAYIRCYCPSTDRMFFLGVEPSNTNAKDSIASLYQVPKILKDNIISIARQGEIFSTTFDEKTTEKLKNNEFCLSELKDYVSLSGNEYFEKIEFEY
jgi:hypothetical protein